MTKSEMENLIEYLRAEVPKYVLGEGIMCRVSEIFDILRKYPEESEKTCGPDYKAMYEVCQIELDKAKAHIESMKFDMHHNAIEHARYVGAVAAMETIFGRKFDPNK